MVKNQSGKMKILFVILTVAMIGFMAPSAFADVVIQETEFPFSIQHPSGWIAQQDPEIAGAVHIDSDLTGRNGVFLQLLCTETHTQFSIENQLYQKDCGNYTAEEELQFLKDDSKHACTQAQYAFVYAICWNHRIIDEYVHEIDGNTSYTILVKEKIKQNGSDPLFPDGIGTNVIKGLETIVIADLGSKNDVWFIAIYNDEDKFDLEVIEKILYSFKTGSKYHNNLDNIYSQENVFPPEPSWFENMMNSIMAIFGFEPKLSEPIINPIIIPLDYYVPEQDYQMDNPIIMDLEF